MKRIIFISICTLIGLNSTVYAQPSNYAWDRFGQSGVIMTINSPVSGIISNTTKATGVSDYYLVEWDTYANKWSNTDTPYNEVFTLTWGGGSFGGPNGKLRTATTTNRYYTLQIQGLDYSNRDAVLMETDNAPVNFAESSPITFASDVYPGQALEIDVVLASAKSSQEKVFVRYTTDGFSTSSVVEVSWDDNNIDGTATIPADVNTAGQTVTFYAYSTTVSATSVSNHDLITLKLSNNGGSDFSYTVKNSWETTNGATSWSNTGSWAGGTLPVAGQPVTIKHDLTLDQSATVSGLTIDAGKTFNLGAQTLTISNNGSITNNGTFTAGTGTVAFAGAATVTGTVSFNNVAISGDVTANSNMTVASTLDIANDKTLTILSGNALITPSGGVNYNTSGKIEFQRTLTSPDYDNLPDGETGHWVGLSSPINGATFAGSGGFLEEIWTQGFTGADNINGDPNIIVFDPSVPGFTAPSSNTITTGQGFAAYLYKNKDRDIDGTAVNYDTPFAVSGSENTFSSGSHTFTLSTNGNGWNFLGNPFGASLEWQADGDWGTGNWTANAALGHNFIYIWNPSTGKYKVSNGGDDTDVNIEGVLDADDSKIAPFQAFWVKSTGTATLLTVSEAARTITSPNAGLFNEADDSGENAISSTPVFSLTLELEDEMSSITAFRFGESYSTLFTENDAYYLSPFGRSFAYLFSYMNDTPALLKSLPVQSDEPIVVPLSVGGYSDLNYYSGEATLTRSQFDNIPASWDVKLIDSHTNTEIDLQTMESYSFTLTPSNKSTGALSMFDLMAEGSPVINTALTNPNKAVTRFSLLINNAVPTSIDPVDELPVSVALAQNYPNPFNPATSIRFELPEAQSVMLEVFDMSGRQIATLASGVHQAGSHEVKFDASDLSSGVYLYRLQTASGTLTRKFTLLK